MPGSTGPSPADPATTAPASTARHGAGASPGARAWSLRTRLLALVLGLTTLAWAVGGAVAVQVAQDTARRLRDERLMHLADTVLAFARHELAEAAMDGQPDEAADPRRQGLDLRHLYQVGRHGQVLVYSAEAPPDRPLAGHWTPGVLTVGEGGSRLRAFVGAPDAAGLQVQVAERLDPLDLGAVWPGPTAWMLVGGSLMLAVALSVALLMRVLRPVGGLARALRQRPLQMLDPLPSDGLPDELRPLIEALNDHLTRSAERLSREHGFTALAAHELRTPLAALRMQVQVAQRLPEGPARQAQLEAVQHSVDRCDHLIGQLLALARVELDPASAHERVALRARAAAVAEDLRASAGARQVGLEVRGSDGELVGSPFGLAVMLRNLLVNAIAHAPPNSVVVVQVHEHPGRVDQRVVLTVDDAGPGIAPADRARVVERFVRLDARTDVRGGAGLGLSIVRGVARAHGAEVELLDAPQGGLRVRISFPAAPDPAGSPARAP